MAKQKPKKTVEVLTHEESTRKNIPTAEYQSVMQKEEQSPVRVAYERRNHDLDPQLVWRGKDEQDWSDLVVPAPPLFIQEKVHPKVLSTTCSAAVNAQGPLRPPPSRASRSTSSRISTACPTPTRRRSFTSTTPTGATA